MSDLPSFVDSTHLDPGEEISEDVIGWSDQAFWVIDGATGLTEETYTDAPTDGRWFVESFSQELTERVDDVSRALRPIVRSCVTTVSDSFDELVRGQTVPEEAQPSGALALVRMNGGELETFTLGDCSVITKFSDGDLKTQFGEGPRELDAKVVEEMRPFLRSDEHNYREAREAVRDSLLEHRRMKNEPGGYWTLGFEPTAVEHATVNRHSVQDLTSAYVFTDGFEPVVDTYDMFVDWPAATSYLDDNGGERAIRLMRAVEASDPECRRYPRLKPKDDAALGILTT